MYSTFHTAAYRSNNAPQQKGNTRASLRYAFNELQAPAVYAITDSNNGASHHVLIKVGLTFIETFEYHGFTHNWYQIDRETFEKEAK